MTTMDALVSQHRKEMDDLEREITGRVAARYGRMFLRLRPAREAVAALVAAQPAGRMTGREVAESPVYEALERAVRAEMDGFVRELAHELRPRLQEAVRDGQRAALDKILAGVPEEGRARALAFLDVPEWLAEDNGLLAREPSPLAPLPGGEGR